MRKQCSSFCTKNSSVENYAVVLNVSLTGINLITNSQIEKNQRIYLTIYYSRISTIYVECEVIWNNKDGNNNLLELKIIEINEIDAYKFECFLNKFERKE